MFSRTWEGRLGSQPSEASTAAGFPDPAAEDRPGLASRLLPEARLVMRESHTRPVPMC